MIESVRVQSGKIEIGYGPGWEEYLKLKDFSEFQNRFTELENRLPSAVGGPKGTGKGAAKGKGKASK